jgi:hypothetical protein
LLIARRRAHALHPISEAGGRALLVFGVLLVHSLPEGFAIGTAWASSVDGLALFVVLAISLQNIPEGTVTAIPLAETGSSRPRQFWAAVATSAPQPVGAVGALLLVEEISTLLPFSFAFAGGAMLALAMTDLVRQGERRPARPARHRQDPLEHRAGYPRLPGRSPRRVQKPRPNGSRSWPTRNATAASTTSPFDRHAANLTFMLVSRRYERASLIVTSNKPFSAWGEIFGDEVAAAAMIDRLVHHAEILALKGDSYRLKDRDLTRPARDD